jgi:dTDP-4-dehydrorhamnose reductase
MNILITGSNGVLGSSILCELKKSGYKVLTLKRKLVDWKGSIKNEILLRGVDIVIHCAANTDLELCERDLYKCFKDNLILTELLAKAAEKNNAKFIFISSTGVYGNYKKTSYFESDIARPTTYYHKSKLFAEMLVLERKNNLVIRTGWIFGGAINNKKNFVINRLKELKNGTSTLYANQDQIGNPTYASDLSKVIVTLIQKNITGLYNCVGEAKASRYEYVKKIFELANVDINVEAKSKNYFKRLSEVSDNESASNRKLNAACSTKMPHWGKSLKCYIKIILSNPKVKRLINEKS